MQRVRVRNKVMLMAFLVITAIAIIAIMLSTTAQGLGPDVKIDPDLTGPSYQNEVSLAIIPGAPGQPQLLLAAYNDQPFAGGPGLGVSRSIDGGVLWIDSQLAYPTHGSGITLVDAFDPSAATDTLGNAFVAHISTDNNWAAGPVSGLYVHKSVDNGVTWLPPVAVSEDGSAAGPIDPNFRFNDRDQMTVDKYASSSYKDNVYIAWIKDRGWNMPLPFGDIYFASSSNSAASFSLATGTSATFPGRINDENVGRDMGNMPVPAVASDGTVYVTWLDYNVITGGTGTIYCDSSTDGGVTWGTDVQVTTVGLPPLNLNPLADNTRAKGAPVLKVSPNNPSELYLVYAEDPDGIGIDDADIHFIKSSEGCSNWSSPITVNNDSTPNDQILPWMDVKPDGTIDIAWYDRRNDPADLQWDVYMAKSTDSGTSFSSNISINDTSFVSGVRGPEGWLGEYMGLAVDSEHAYVAWTSTVTDTLGDVYFDKIDNLCFPGTTPVKPSLSLSVNNVYWQNMANYTARLMNIDFDIQNTGGNSAYNTSITSSTASSTVTSQTTMPVSIGVVATGSTVSTTLQYTVPMGVSSFIVNVYASADDGCGNGYTYP